MSFADEASAPSRATRIRYLMIAVATLTAVLLYLERVCLSVAAPYIREDLRLSAQQLNVAISVFFWAYALGQVPTGWFSDRFGPRRMMVVYLVTWSLFGILIALATGFWTFIAARLALGLFQAGAYPTLAILVKRWVPDHFRGVANSLVAFGGRFGAAAANLLTAWMIVWCVPMSTPAEIEPRGILDSTRLVKEVIDEDPAKSKNLLRPILAERLRSEFPGDSLTRLRESRADAEAAFKAAATATHEGDPPPLAPPTDAQLGEVVGALNAFIKSRIDLGPLPKEVQLSSDATAIERKPSAERTEQEFQRLNRLLVEKAYPETIEQLHVAGWRPTLFLFGAAGVLVGVVFWAVARDWPHEHPGCNEAELALIRGTGEASTEVKRTPPIPWLLLLLSPNMWYSSLMQFGVNVGWAFIITLFPTYLIQRFQVSIEQAGLMGTMPQVGGCIGMLLGGWLTDRATKSLGLRWGRGLFLGPLKLLGAVSFAVCPFLDDPWAVAWMLTFFAFSSDMGIPSTWAFAQDTGGKHVGSVLGWGNMVGNLGAGMSSTLAGWILLLFPTRWDYVMFVFSSAFLFAAFFGSLMDCRVPLEPEEDDPDPELRPGPGRRGTTG